MFKRSTRALFGLGVVAVTGLLLTFAGPAVAHHPFAMAEGGDMNALQGLISGIGHPLLGPDHLLFLLAIGLIGLRRPVAWVLPLLAFALGGAVLTQIFPLPSSLAPAAEVLVSLTLAVEGLIALNIIPAGILLPVIGLHGYLLGGAIVVESPDSMEQFQDPQTYGSGRPVLTLKHDFMDPANKVGAHFWIRQMWQ